MNATQMIVAADTTRLDGVRVIGVDEHRWSHTRRPGEDGYVTVIVDLTPVLDGIGAARLLDLVPGRSAAAFKTWLDQRTKLLRADPNEDIAAAWIAKERLRTPLSCAERGGLRYEIQAALDRFYRFCAACLVFEVISFARTIEAWQAPIIAAVQNGLTNARTEGNNRIVKQVKRTGCGFRNRDNSARRIRFHCTRNQRAVTQTSC
ncbi:hypothetical protein NGTWS1803_28390 [Mycolicibacterium cyprinidarum]|nr:hypothetical protein NGTWS1803_28390 [Mycolicibacterium sp. NGTWS1803]